MEHINKIEIQGRVGTVRMNVVNDKKVANFSVATDHIYKGMDGVGISETTWHSVVAWESSELPDLSFIQKGVPLNVQGRLRCNKYTSSDGVEKQYFEILAQKIKPLKKDSEE